MVAGGANVDIQGRSYAQFARGDSNPGNVSVTPGGVGRNVAENLARLGERVELLSVFGDDDMSAWLVESCRRLGIGVGHSHFASDTSVSRYLCLLDCDGTLAGAIASMDSMEGLTLERFAPSIEAVSLADALMIDGNFPSEIIGALARKAKGSGRAIVGFDPVSVTKAPRGLPHLDAFDFIKPNRAEASVLSGLAIGDFASLKRAASRLLSLGVGAVYVSLGAEGLYFDDGDSSGVAAPPRFDPVNVSGAGDAACAAIVRATLDALPLAERARLAVAAASLAAMSRDTVNEGLDAASLDGFKDRVSIAFR